MGAQRGNEGPRFRRCTRDNRRAAPEGQRQAGRVRSALSVHGHLAETEWAVADHRRAGRPDPEMIFRKGSKMSPAPGVAATILLASAIAACNSGTKTSTADSTATEGPG